MHSDLFEAQLHQLELDNVLLVQENSRLQTRLAEMENTRLWQMALRFWRWRDWLKFWRETPGLLSILRIESAVIAGSTLTIEGWADRYYVRSRQTVRFLADGKLLGEAPCDRLRPDLSTKIPYQAAMHCRGFKFSADVAQPLSQITVQLVNGRGRTVEMHISPQVDRPQIPAPIEAVPLAVSYAPATRNVLFCMASIPQFDRWGGQRRAFEMMKMFRRLGCHVTLWVRDMIPDVPDDRYINALTEHGISVYGSLDSTGIRQEVAISFEHLITRHTFKCVFLVSWQVAEPLIPILRHYLPQMPILVDTVDLQFLNYARKAFYERGSGSLDDDYALNVKRELNTYSAAKRVLTVSARETDYLNDLLGGQRAQVLRDVVDLSSRSIPFSQRRGIVFVGNYRYAPNLEAVKYTLSHIWPHLDQSVQQAHPFFIVGDGLEPSVQEAWRRIPNVEIVGWVPSIMPYLEQARLAIAPLHYGAGTKNKVIAAMGAGLPIVTTAIGAEGLAIRDHEHLWIADTDEAFAAAIVRLLNDESCWNSIARQAKEYAETYHSGQAVQQALEVVLDSLWPD
jgi:O-antigen biosynthesis protein